MPLLLVRVLRPCGLVGVIQKPRVPATDTGVYFEAILQSLTCGFLHFFAIKETFPMGLSYKTRRKTTRLSALLFILAIRQPL